MRKQTKIIAASLSAALGLTGAAAAKEAYVRTGMENGKPFVVSAPVGNCALNGAVIGEDGRMHITLTVRSETSEDAAPSSVEVVTARGRVEAAPDEGGKGGPGSSTGNWSIPVGEMVSPLPVNPTAPTAAVVAETPDGAAVCGTVTVIPHAAGVSGQGR